MEKYGSTEAFDSNRVNKKPILDMHLLAELVTVQLPYINGLGLSNHATKQIINVSQRQGSNC